MCVFYPLILVAGWSHTNSATCRRQTWKHTVGLLNQSRSVLHLHLPHRASSWLRQIFAQRVQQTNQQVEHQNMGEPDVLDQRQRKARIDQRGADGLKTPQLVDEHTLALSSLFAEA